ncbi:MAG: hypothetical protein ACTH8F_08730 [Microbacterium sp.]|uniref:hypothetical protein n=1 Tax=Microbacterium sp. TaxID=51671 RepID=UPI003F965F0D
MTPSAALRAQGSPATWLHNSVRAHRADRPGEFRYLVSSLDTAAVADLAMLALDGWLFRVATGSDRRVRVTLTRPAKETP